MNKELCARCARYATDEIYCERHYNQWLSEWSCYLCGGLNGGIINRYRVNCGYCGNKKVTWEEYKVILGG